MRRRKCGVYVSLCGSHDPHDLDHGKIQHTPAHRTHFTSVLILSYAVLATIQKIICLFSTDMGYWMTYFDVFRACQAFVHLGRPFSRCGHHCACSVPFYKLLARPSGKSELPLSFLTSSCCPLLRERVKMMVGEPEEMLSRTESRKGLLTMDQRNSSSDLFISISGLIGTSLR